MNCTITTTGDLTDDLPGDSADELPGTPVHDVTVVGAAIAREPARYRLRTALVDASDDIGNGTSKANAAIATGAVGGICSTGLTASMAIAAHVCELLGDRIPDHELARRGAVTLDPGTRGPAYDASYRTTETGVFAVGNLLHGVESAGIAAAEGRAVAAPVLRHLAADTWPVGRPSVAVDSPLQWIAPNLIGPGGDTPLRGRFTLRTSRRLPSPLLVVRQDGRVLHRQRLLLPAVPGRPFHLRADWLDRVDPHGATVRIAMH